MREVIFTNHVPVKPHVLICLDSHPYPQDLILKLMTQTVNFKFQEKYTLNILSTLPICDTCVKPEGGF